jgi:predicted metal-binding membrane protein
MPAVEAFDRVVRRDRLLIGAGLGATTLLAWAYLLRAAASMQAMSMQAEMHAAMGMADPHVWGVADGLALLVMWTAMMVAMMLPSAAPVIVLVLGVYRRRGDARAQASAHAFMAGYLLAWFGFSVAASAAQFGLHRAALLAPDMRLTSGITSGVILIVAGIYQWLPIKGTCLSHCQSPFAFLSQHWREGTLGGLTMGMRHGLFCLGCCWLLMTLLFVVGVMNLVWVAGLAAFVLLEKLTRAGTMLGRVAGAGVVAWGLYLMISA